MTNFRQKKIRTPPRREHRILYVAFRNGGARSTPSPLQPTSVASHNSFCARLANFGSPLECSECETSLPHAIGHIERTPIGLTHAFSSILIDASADRKRHTCPLPPHLPRAARQNNSITTTALFCHNIVSLRQLVLDGRNHHLALFINARTATIARFEATARAIPNLFIQLVIPRSSC